MQLITIKSTKRATSFLRVDALALAICVTLGSTPLSALAFSGNARSSVQLEYGAVLFDYFQKDYFSALIEQKYAQTLQNRNALSPSGQLLKGGMMLSYGLADESEKVFQELLENNAPQEVQNRAWFYLAKLHYNKSDTDAARAAINRVNGKIPADILIDYHYLATLISSGKGATAERIAEVEKTARNSPYFPYFLFNMAVAYLAEGNLVAAVETLERVTRYSSTTEEHSVLADRARHGLSELAMQTDRLPAAWQYLSGIRTTGLYSNRALLSYVWAAINQQQFQEAIPALEILSSRSVALPEVQEAKVLLAHVYEQNGDLRRALRRNISAEQEFIAGVNLIAQAREVIEGQDVPREFISNLEAIMDNTDWYAARPSIDYQRLTPFLVDLMASNAFTEALRELADLYVIEDNLNYWADQADQHRLILLSADKKNFNDEVAQVLSESAQLKADFLERSKEISLYSLMLDEDERNRLSALMETTAAELTAMESKVNRLGQVKEPYRQPPHFHTMVADKHKRIEETLTRTEQQILALEKIMRQLIGLELNKHEERMNYYMAQSRLAKARLYDMTLLSLEGAAPLSAEGKDKSGDQPR